MYRAILSKSPDSKYKYEVRIFGEDGRKSTVKFGASGYGDFTLGTSEQQKKSYIARHQHNEDWTKTGYFKAGFWSRWILWNKRTVQDSIRDIENKFNNIKIFLE